MNRMGGQKFIPFMDVLHALLMLEYGKPSLSCFGWAVLYLYDTNNRATPGNFADTIYGITTFPDNEGPSRKSCCPLVAE